MTHEIKYITTQHINNPNIDKELPPCISFSDVRAYIIKVNENKYLIFVLTENNKNFLNIYKKLCSKITREIKCYTIETTNSSKCNFTESIKYERDPTRIRLDSYNDDLP